MKIRARLELIRAAFSADKFYAVIDRKIHLIHAKNLDKNDHDSLVFILIGLKKGVAAIENELYGEKQ